MCSCQEEHCVRLHRQEHYFQCLTVHKVLLGLVDEATAHTGTAHTGTLHTGAAHTGPASVIDVALQTDHPFLVRADSSFKPYIKTPEISATQATAHRFRQRQGDSHQLTDIVAVSDKELHTNSQPALMRLVPVSDEELHTNSPPDHMQLVAVSNKALHTNSQITCSTALSSKSVTWCGVPAKLKAFVSVRRSQPCKPSRAAAVSSKGPQF